LKKNEEKVNVAEWVVKEGCLTLVRSGVLSALVNSTSSGTIASKSANLRFFEVESVKEDFEANGEAAGMRA